MSGWPSLPRRLLLRLAGAGLAGAPLSAMARGASVPGASPAGTRDQGGRGQAGPGTPAIAPADVWTVFFKGQRLWAYADRMSLAPGESLNVMAAGGPGQPHRRARLEVFRIGAGGSEPVWTSDFADIGYLGATASGAAIGPGWPATFADIDTRAWRPGCYTCDLVEQTTGVRDVKAAQWIVTNPARSGAVLCRLGTNTYQAYNPWGGHSLYPNGDDETRGLMVTFDRPTPPAFYEYDAYLVAWLESLAPSLGGIDYAGNFDIHAHPDLMSHYPLVITGSHDEYWSKEEFDAFHRRIFTEGRNTAFFGADAAYCQVRYGDLNRAPGAPELGRQIVCYKTASDPIARRAGPLDPALLITADFRQDARRPETMLMGGAYQNWFEPASDQRPAYHVASAGPPFFAGTGWRVGDRAADVIGYEWDNRDPEGDGRRLWDAALSRNAAIDPKSVLVLFQGHAVGDDGQPGLAEATYFVSKAGAKVFNAGAVRWAWGLGRDGFVEPAFQKFNENLVRAFSAR